MTANIKKNCERKVNVNSMLMKNQKYNQLETSLMKKNYQNHIDDGNTRKNERGRKNKLIALSTV